MHNIQLIWSDEAGQDLLRIYEYIAKDSPPYAQRMIERIIGRGKQILAFPYSGVRVSGRQDADIRQVLAGNYRIIYHVGDDAITVLTVVHSARKSVFEDR